MSKFVHELGSTLFHSRLTKDRILSLILVFAAFLVTAQWGTFLYKEIGTTPAMIWAPVGIAFASVILGGYGLLPAVFLGTLANGMMNGAPFLLLLIGALGNTIQPAVGYYFLEKTGFDRSLSKVRDVFLMLLMSIFVTMIVPTVNAAAIFLYNRMYGMAHPIYWEAWWVGGALSALILTPFFIRWIRFPMLPHPAWKIAESIAATLSVVMISILVFCTAYTAIGDFSLLYPLLIAFVWLAFRAGPRYMSLALFLMTIISLLGALYGTHPPPVQELSKRVFNTEIFDLIMAVTFFMLVSVEEQRKTVVKALKENALELQGALGTIRTEEQAKNDFIATLAHELRNPLATLLSSTELLALDGKIKGGSHELVEIMHSRILTMSRLLDDLLDIARITRKELTVHKEPVALSGVIRHALETVGHALQKKNQTLGVSLPIERVIVEADPTRLEQIFVNLLYNAVKYTPEEGHIDLTVKYQNGTIWVAVSDTGIGIPDNMLTKIFEPFVQAAKGPRTENEGLGTGLGIGLSLTKTLVEMHGGTIEARKNAEGRGSEFVLKLPATVEYTADLQPSKIRPSALVRLSNKPSKNGLEILVVDDNETAAVAIGKLLALRGHRVSIATDGKSAIEDVPRLKPHAILLDLGLGDMDGCDVAREIRKENKDTVLIAMTGYGQAEDKKRTAEAGFQYHMTKPVGLSDLETVLEQVAAM